MHFPGSLLLAATSTLLLLQAARPASAYPNGAPACAINETRISGMGGSNQDLGYRISTAATYTPGRTSEITLSGTAGYKGLLLYVESARDAKKRNGNFEIPAGFKSNKDKCDSQGISAGPRGAVTHADPKVKAAGTVFRWTSDADTCEDVVIRAVVAKEQAEWQILPAVTVRCAGQAKAPGKPQDTAPPQEHAAGKDDAEDYAEDYADTEDYTEDADTDAEYDTPAYGMPEAAYSDSFPGGYGQPAAEDYDDVSGKPQWQPRHPRGYGMARRPWGRRPRYVERIRVYEPAHFGAPPRHRRHQQCHRGRSSRSVRSERYHGRQWQQRSLSTSRSTQSASGVETTTESRSSTDTAYPQQPASAYPPASDTSNQQQKTQPSAYPQQPESDVSQQQQNVTAYLAASVSSDTASAYPPTQTLGGSAPASEAVVASQSTTASQKPAEATHAAQPVKSSYMMAQPNGDSAYYDSSDDSY